MSGHWHYLDSPPALPGLFMQAAMRRKVTGTRLPDLGLRCWVSVDPDKVNAFAKVCGFIPGSLLPPTYPHVLAFPLQMKLLTDKDFPFPLLGLIHVQNRISIRRPLGGVAKAQVSVRVADLRPHAKGATFNLITQFEDALGLLWEEHSTMLCRGVNIEGELATAPERERLPITELANWYAPADIGRQYARVSGDYNPIHLSDISARLFGFPTAIAHGLWMKSRALAALDDHLPASNVDISVEFHKPVRLPSEVTLSASAAGSHGQLKVEGREGIVHLVGSWQPASE
ncbi:MULTISPECIES: MaoC/PaaZ C-terminal domain-containing protein [unclassified Pseudomonas]|uniref:MaoC/PaaZ C-terminal domain-containing protein n=1 Tax=unclassified Pseudomonas TaxID=196821 RepID=UPI0025F1EB6C|nr:MULTISPECIES: MaoC/PaaZ C-terminal domain-containing protein [unclassified Pseudomonas]